MSNNPTEEILTEIMVKTPISKTRIGDLLCTALEGGSNYWYCIDKFIKPNNFQFRYNTMMDFDQYDFPLNDGGALIISDKEDENPDEERKTYKLDLVSLKRGIQVMAEKYPKDFSDFLEENYDAFTGDTFLQCCLFGEVIYG
jgi:hypothetical protein